MKYCFIGLGSIARKHIGNIRQIDNESIIHAYRTGKSNYEDIDNIVDKSVYDITDLEEFYDAIFVTNPTSNHYETLKKFINKSDCFFIEKPVFSNYLEEQLLDSFKNKLTYIAAPLRFCSGVKYAKELVSRSSPISARLISSSYLPDWRPGVDYRNTYSAHSNMGGGVNIDLIHELDYLVYLFGFPKKSIYINKKVSNLDIDSYDLSTSIHEYESMVGEIHLDYFGRDKKRICELYFNDSTYYIDLINNLVKIVANGEKEEIFLNPSSMYYEEMEYFISLIVNKTTKSNNNINEANSVLRIINLGSL